MQHCAEPTPPSAFLCGEASVATACLSAEAAVELGGDHGILRAALRVKAYIWKVLGFWQHML